MKRKEFKHPELRSGEVFISNANAGSFPSKVFRRMSGPVIDLTKIKTKRMGKISFDPRDNETVLDDRNPIFAERQELEKLGINIEGEFNIFV